jgi:RNA polymerase sigma-70 factor, ECF subfamily
MLSVVIDPRGMFGIPRGPGLAPGRSRCYVRAMRRAEGFVTPLTTSDDDDARLMRALAKGDQSALAQIYDRYAPLLMALGQRVLQNRREAEDLLHDVFLEAWRCAKDYDPTRGTVRAWLSMRMRSRALDRVRAQGRARVVLSSDPEGPDAVTHDDDLGSGADHAKIRKAIAALPAEQRQVLELGYFHGLTSAEIATEAKIPIGTVKSRVARGLASLRSQILDEEKPS